MLAERQSPQSSRGARELLRGPVPLLAAALVALAHFASFAWRDHPLVTDVRHFVYFAQRTSQGALPHLDFFDNKTPLATFAGAALYRLGEVAGADPLWAVRLGFLALAAGAATLAFAVFRTLTGSPACGVLALAFHAGFWLLGLLPAVGNVPKLAMAVLAAASALSVHARAWLLAGALGMFAALDWQLGALALAGALVGAGLRPRGERGKAAARVAAGAALAALPVVALYASRGALGVLYRQTIEASLFRGAATRAQSGAGGEWARRLQVVAAGTDGHTWLLAVALVGVPVYVFWLRSPRAEGTRELAGALAVYHYGMLGFSLRDFQVYGDLFALLHTAAFFGAVAAGEAWRRLRGRAAGGWGAPAVAALACLAIGRPWVDRGALRVPGLAGAPLTLAEQRTAARELHALRAAPTTAVLGASELLFLDGQRNPLPFVVWNPAVFRFYRRSADEPRTEALERLLAEAGVDRLVCDPGYPPCAALGAFRLAETVRPAPGYALEVYVRVNPRSPAP